MAPLANGVAGFVVRLEIILTLIRPPSSLPPSPTTCTVCLLPPSSITTTNNHESMMLRLATKAGTMTGRRGAHPNLGKVACVLLFGGRGCWWGGGGKFGARDRILPEAC
jgi:hypothetical protein